MLKLSPAPSDATAGSATSGKKPVEALRSQPLLQWDRRPRRGHAGSLPQACSRDPQSGQEGVPLEPLKSDAGTELESVVVVVDMYLPFSELRLVLTGSTGLALLNCCRSRVGGGLSGGRFTEYLALSSAKEKLSSEVLSLPFPKIFYLSILCSVGNSVLIQSHVAILRLSFSFGTHPPIPGLVSFFEYLEKIELYCSKENYNLGIFRELENFVLLF